MPSIHICLTHCYKKMKSGVMESLKDNETIKSLDQLMDNYNTNVGIKIYIREFF